MTNEGKKNPRLSKRAKKQNRDSSSGRFTKASAASAGVGDIVPDVPSGFEMVTPNPNRAAGVGDIVPDVPPGFEMVTPNPKRATGSSSSSGGHKDCFCCITTGNELTKLKKEFMDKVEELEEMNTKHSIKIWMLEQKGKGDDKAIAKLRNAVQELKKNESKD